MLIKVEANPHYSRRVVGDKFASGDAGKIDCTTVAMGAKDADVRFVRMNWSDGKWALKPWRVGKRCFKRLSAAVDYAAELEQMLLDGLNYAVRKQA